MKLKLVKKLLRMIRRIWCFCQKRRDSSLRTTPLISFNVHAVNLSLFNLTRAKTLIECLFMVIRLFRSTSRFRGSRAIVA